MKGSQRTDSTERDTGLETFKHSVEVAAAGGRHSDVVEMVVATEFACFEVPDRIRRELVIEPFFKRSYARADGRQVEMDIGRTWVTLDGGDNLRMAVVSVEDFESVFGVFARVQLDSVPDPPREGRRSPDG